MWALDSVGPFLQELAEPVAVCSVKGVVVYGNRAFEPVAHMVCDAVGRKLRPELHRLIRQMDAANKADLLKGVAIPLADKHVLSVFSTYDSMDTNRGYILLVKFPNTEKQRTPYQSADARSGSLSAEGRPSSEKLLPEFDQLVGEDISFKLALYAAQRAARTDFPVLITGESGTGKEILAQTIHRTSERKKFPFVDINCAAIPDTLIESELFGYERGAFTGANREGRRGLFDEANGGSIFLDEIGDASLQTQSKLLRVLQEGCFKRVGGSRNIRVNVRHIAATNKDLMGLMNEARFREDLFYRLNTITIRLPPLRERRRDIGLLIDHFLGEHVRKKKRKIRFPGDSMALMESYEWPGNVRELKSVVDYAITMSTGSLITADCLPSFLLARNGPSNRAPLEPAPISSTADDRTLDLTTAVRSVEKDLLEKALARSANRSEAIRSLGISRRTFYLKLKQYGLE